MVLPGLGQQFFPGLLAHQPQGVELLVVKFCPPAHACFVNLGEPGALAGAQLLDSNGANRVCWDYFRLARHPRNQRKPPNRVSEAIKDYGWGRSSSTTSERSCTRSRTTSRPSGEMSKSRMWKSGAK